MSHNVKKIKYEHIVRLWDDKEIQQDKFSEKKVLICYLGGSLVKDDLDGIARRSLYDPFAVKGLLIEFWPAGGEDDPAGSLQIPSTWG